MREDIERLLAQLRLLGMAEALERELARAEKHGCGVAEVLHRLLLEEARYRGERSLAYRVVQAKLPWPWTLETFPFEHQPGVSKTQIQTLAGLEFIRRAENLVLIGNPGTGKTGLAIGLLREACLNGYRGRFYKAQDLIDELYASLADRSTAKLLNRLARYPVLVIDELGYLSVNPEQTNAFFNLLDRRYNRVSTVITTNLDFPQWYEQFQRKSLVDALLDRLQHHCITIRIDGPSLRAPVPPDDAPPTAPKRSNKKTKAPPNKSARSTRSRGASPPT
jgi:DNA replication protein DnaC